MPWFDIQQADAPADSYDLDYTGMLLPVVILQSFKRKHFLVFVAAIIGIALKVQIALSSSVFQSVLIQRPHPIDVRIMNVFADSVEIQTMNVTVGTDLVLEEQRTNSTIDSEAYVAAIQQFNLDLPFGVSLECAYLTFTALDSNGVVVTPRPDQPLTVTVDGLFMDAECKLLESYDMSAPTTPKPDDRLLHELRFEGCEDVVKYDYPLQKMYLDDERNFGEAHRISFVDESEDGSDRPCSSLPQQNRQFVYSVTEFIPSPQNESLVHIGRTEAVICSSIGWISKVEVVDNGVSRTISRPVDQGTNTSLDLDPWEFLSNTSTLTDFLSQRNDGSVSEDSSSRTDGTRPDSSSGSPQFQSDELGVTVRELTRNYTIMMAHDQLRRDSETSALGTRTKTVARLQINLGVCISMTVMSAVGTVLAFCALCQRRKMVSHFYRDPATVLGSIVHVCGSNKQLLRQRKEAPGQKSPEEEMGAQKAAWSDGYHSPLALTSNMRAAIVLFVLVLITAIAISLKRSQDHDGLMNIDGGGYWPLLWQLFPTLMMLIVSLYASSSDTAIRGLAGLSDLLDQPCHSSNLDVSLLDMLGARVFQHSISLRMPTIALSQLLAVLCGLLPVISSVLLTTEYVPHLVDIADIEEESWFGTREITDDNVQQFVRNREGIGRLSLLQSIANFTSPRHTFQDLLFPSFRINDFAWGPGMSASVEVSAAKLSPTCTQLSEGDFQTRNYTSGDIVWVEVLQQIECPDSRKQNVSLVQLNHKVFETNSYYFGGTISMPAMQDSVCDNSSAHLGKVMPPWVEQRYAWGNYSTSEERFEYLSVWKCNFTWVDVATEVNLLWSGGETIIDHNNPPVWDKSSSQPWTPPFGVPVLAGYGLLNGTFPSAFTKPEGGVLTLDRMSAEFSHIMEPYGRTKFADLGQPDQDRQVLEALSSRVAFAAAQLANVEQRLGLNELSDSAPSTAPTRESRGPITGTITDNLRQRVIQNQSISFTLIALLSVVAAVQMWALASDIWRRSSVPHRRQQQPWLLDLERRGVAPPDFGSVNMMASLLDGSNCAGVLPDNAHLMPAEALQRHLAGKEFRLGWFQNAETGADIYTIGVLNEGDLVFKSGVQRLKKSKESDKKNRGQVSVIPI